MAIWSTLAGYEELAGGFESIKGDRDDWDDRENWDDWDERDNWEGWDNWDNPTLFFSFQGSVLPVPTERLVGERPWERGWGERDNLDDGGWMGRQIWLG